MARQRLAQALDAAVQQLPDDLQRLFRMARSKLDFGLSDTELARNLGLGSRNTLEARRKRLREALRAAGQGLRVSKRLVAPYFARAATQPPLPAVLPGPHPGHAEALDQRPVDRQRGAAAAGKAQHLPPACKSGAAGGLIKHIAADRVGDHAGAAAVGGGQNALAQAPGRQHQPPRSASGGRPAGSVAVAITHAPRCRPICTQAWPTPPRAPCTSRVSPGCKRPSRAWATQAARPVTCPAAAMSSATPAGTGRSAPPGITAGSASSPVLRLNITAWLGNQPLAGPASATVPAPSMPTTKGRAGWNW